jgi:hypothetical protein
VAVWVALYQPANRGGVDLATLSIERQHTFSSILKPWSTRCAPVRVNSENGTKLGRVWAYYQSVQNSRREEGPCQPRTADFLMRKAHA